MIKLLDDLLIAATCNPNVPGAIVAGLRQVLDEARAALPSPWPQEAEPATVCVSHMGSRDLPPPFDSMEEAQRAAGIWPVKIVMPLETVDPADTYYVCVKVPPQGYQVGHVIQGHVAASLREYWLPCDKEGWVSGRLTGPAGLDTEWRGHPGLSDWRPMRQAQFAFTTGHADAIPKSSALDEMAEQVRRWAAPTREEAECAYAAGGPLDPNLVRHTDPDSPEAFVPIDDEVTLHGRTGVLNGPALAVQEGGSHYKGMKIQPVEYIHANGIGYFEGNVVKYVSRWRAKGGVQDLKKARHYLDLLIELEGGAK